MASKGLRTSGASHRSSPSVRTQRCPCMVRRAGGCPHIAMLMWSRRVGAGEFWPATGVRVALPDVGPRVLLELESGAASAKWARATGGCASATPPPALRTWCSPLRATGSPASARFVAAHRRGHASRPAPRRPGTPDDPFWSRSAGPAWPGDGAGGAVTVRDHAKASRTVAAPLEATPRPM